LKDLDRREIAILVPIILAMFWIGIYSSSFLRKMDASVQQSLRFTESREGVVRTSRPSGSTQGLAESAGETSALQK